MPKLTARQIAEAVNGRLTGRPDLVITGIAQADQAGPNDLTLLAADRYFPVVKAGQAGLVLTTAAYDLPGRNTLVVEDPESAMDKVLSLFAGPVDRPAAGVHPTAVVAEDADLADGVAVGPRVVIGPRSRIGPRTCLQAGVYVGSDVRIGADCTLWPNVVVLQQCIIGDRVVIHPNSTIGADGFGYLFSAGRHEKIPQIGGVLIEDDVEIGANCAVDRAKWGRTVIGRGTKIDNLVQIAHNVRVGRNCIIVAQVGVAGSTELGNHVVLGGKVGLKDHIRIGDGAQAAGCCCISKDVPPGEVVNGIPAIPNRQYLREQAAVRKLPDLLSQVKELTRRVQSLESANDH